MLASIKFSTTEGPVLPPLGFSYDLAPYRSKVRRKGLTKSPVTFLLLSSRERERENSSAQVS